MFTIRLHTIQQDKHPLAETHYSDHASRIARNMAELYGYRVDVFEAERPGVEDRLVEYWEIQTVEEHKLMRVPIDPRTGQPYT